MKHEFCKMANSVADDDSLTQQGWHIIPSHPHPAYNSTGSNFTCLPLIGKDFAAQKCPPSHWLPVVELRGLRLSQMQPSVQGVLPQRAVSDQSTSYSRKQNKPTWGKSLSLTPSGLGHRPF
uniref:Uncharacterized protein n=1 Tax=Sphaerodactylus townsendi TaxID=933632 RepID=A0ACB8F2K4_9SAUR